MRGSNFRQGALFSLVDLDSRIHAKYPICQIVETTLATLGSEFSARYFDTGYSSIPPKQLLRISIQKSFIPSAGRQQVEECFGWAKTVGGFRKTRFIGTARVHAWALLTFAAYNLTRMMTLFGWREEFRQAKSVCVM